MDELGGVAALERLMPGDEQDALAAAMVSAAIGRSHSTASAQDVQWAVRRLLESLARHARRWWSRSTTSSGPSRRCST